MSPAGPVRPLVHVFLPFALGYYLSYLFRIVNAVIAPELTAELGIGPSDLGLLTAAFFLSFALSQLPLGLLLDRYGPRRVEATLLVLASIGALAFGLSHNLAGLIAGRSLIGLGVSACLMAGFTAFAAWFPYERLSLLNGMILAAGGLGAISATTPVQMLMQFMTWRSVFLILSGLTLITAWIVFHFVPDKHRHEKPEQFGDSLAGIQRIFTSPVFWGLGIPATASQAAFLSVIGLWIGPWLQNPGGINRDHVAGTLAMVTLMMVIGYLVNGKITERMARKRRYTLPVAITGMVLFVAVQIWLILLPTTGTRLAWLLFGCTGTSGVLCYSELTRRFGGHLAGRVNTALNLLVFVAAFISQWGIGVILENFPKTGYELGFGSLVGIQILGLVWFGLQRRRFREPAPVS
jgi:MFS family permease